jgi:hypothetical protein
MNYASDSAQHRLRTAIPVPDRPKHYNHHCNSN